MFFRPKYIIGKMVSLDISLIIVAVISILKLIRNKIIQLKAKLRTAGQKIPFLTEVTLKVSRRAPIEGALPTEKS